MTIFSPDVVSDKKERNDRFLEEALELVQSLGYSQQEAHWMVRYVYDRPQGDVNQEVGGVMVTLASLCIANGMDMDKAADTELARCWENIDKIRLKQAAKPKMTVVALPIDKDAPPIPVDVLFPGQKHPQGISEREVLEAELKELEAANEAAEGWGAAVGARSSRIKRIRSRLNYLDQLAQRETNPPNACSDPIVDIQKICRDNFGKDAKAEHEALNDIYRRVNFILMDRKNRKAEENLTDAQRVEAEGFVVDRFVYPWLAYKGPRFAPTESKSIRTDMECGQLKNSMGHLNEYG
jgi:hypothetical protein